jgi:hypothetical protein
VCRSLSKPESTIVESGDSPKRPYGGELNTYGMPYSDSVSSKMPANAIKSAHPSSDTVISVKLFGPYSAPKKNKGFLDRAARKRDTDVWDRPRARARFGRHNSSTAAENHLGQREAPFVPCLKAAGKRSNTLKSTAA